MNKKLFIIAAGTGGHIIPALALYYKIKKNYTPFFICRKKDVQIVEQLKSFKKNILFLPGRGFKRKFAFINILSIVYLFYGIFISFFWLLNYRPVAILSFGGYLSFPVLVNAVIMKKTLFLFEQNSYPGIVNRIFKKWANTVFVNFAYSARFFKNSIVVGNPIRESLKSKISTRYCRQFFNFKNTRDVILVMGGSQGSLKINEIFSQIVEKLKKFNIIWITGKMHYKKFKVFQQKGRIFITPYLSRMEYVYNITKIAITRAGALTITELACFGIPAIFIPLPHSAENHQLKNAKIIEKAKSAIVIQENQLSQEVLLKSINKLIKNYKTMSSAIKKFYIPDATEQIIKILKKEIG